MSEEIPFSRNVAIVVTDYKRVPVSQEEPARGFRSVEAGKRRVIVRLLIDTRDLAEKLGLKAYRNKSKSSTAQDRSITCEVVEIGDLVPAVLHEREDEPTGEPIQDQPISEAPSAPPVPPVSS